MNPAEKMIELAHSAHSFEVKIISSPYHWILFCTRCGYVAWHGNFMDKSKEMQANLPPSCGGLR